MTWIQSKTFDLTFILLPPFLVILVLFLFPNLTDKNAHVSTLSWLLIILAVDVTHVYSSLWRTYWHKENFLLHKSSFTLIPVFSWVIGVVLYSLDEKLFWTSLAYLAVFHFIRQQYGFMRLYSKDEKQGVLSKKIDSLLIHALCLYPLIFWHVNLPRNFHWMIEGDFIFRLPIIIESLGFWFYCALIGIYLLKEFKKKSFNLPKNLILLGTGLTWYLGIIYFNSDVSFTLTNVLAHGLPYLALVWVFEKKEHSRLQRWWGPGVFIGVAFIFAYVEESVWAGLIWREHLSIFKFMEGVPPIKESSHLSLLIPLLTLPQTTHYILDGFIWRQKHAEIN